MAPSTASPVRDDRPAQHAGPPSPYAHLLDHVDVLVDHRRIGPMPFEDAVSLRHELAREGIPLARIRVVQARHPHHAGLAPAAPRDGARAPS